MSDKHNHVVTDKGFSLFQKGKQKQFLPAKASESAPWSWIPEMMTERIGKQPSLPSSGEEDAQTCSIKTHISPFGYIHCNTVKAELEPHCQDKMDFVEEMSLISSPLARRRLAWQAISASSHALVKPNWLDPGKDNNRKMVTNGRNPAGGRSHCINRGFPFMAVGAITNTLSTCLQGHRLQYSEYTAQPGDHTLSLSVTCYSLLSGKPVFVGTHRRDVAAVKRNEKNK